MATRAIAMVSSAIRHRSPAVAMECRTHFDPNSFANPLPSLRGARDGDAAYGRLRELPARPCCKIVAKKTWRKGLTSSCSATVQRGAAVGVALHQGHGRPRDAVVGDTTGLLR